MSVEALSLCLWVLIALCAATWLASLLTNEHSWVDRIWSIAPVVYAWIFASGAGFASLRLNVIAALITLWGTRLTFNFARKGGYRPGGEDYRWEHLRQGMNPAAYQVFSLLFIAIFQNVLLLLITLPMQVALDNVRVPFGATDGILALLFVGLLVTETVADQQQWDFQQFKKAEQAAGREVKPGFLRTGLFSLSRHPNFFCELAQWWVVFLFGATATGTVLNWSVTGPLLLTALFIGSTRFTEAISASKYPEYEEYRNEVSALIPWFSRK